MTKKPTYKPEQCEHCLQKTTYLLAIDRGTVQIVKQIARFIGKKGINAVHPRKEMEGIMLTSNEVGNLTRPRAHGLIARVRGNPGNYLLTKKGSQFLHGAEIPRYAIRSKVEHKTIGYLEGYTAKVGEFDSNEDYWEGCGYSIEEGDIINKLPST